MSHTVPARTTLDDFHRICCMSLPESATFPPMAAFRVAIRVPYRSNLHAKLREPILAFALIHAYTSQDQATCSLGLNAENILNSGADLQPGSIALLRPFRQLAASGTLALKMFAVSGYLHLLNAFLRTIGRIRPDIAGIARVQQLRKNVAVMSLGAGYRKTPQRRRVGHLTGS